MAKGPEGRLIDKIHRQTAKYLTKDNVAKIYHQKMNMAPGSPSGTPDVYYEGNKSELWIEYKHVPTWDNKRKIPISKITPNQINWLTRAVNNNRRCAVIFGDDKGRCIILTMARIFNTTEVAGQKLFTPTEVAEWISILTIKAN